MKSINDPSISSVELTDLIPEATYKFRLKMIHSEDLVDNNKFDLVVVMNQAPEVPSSLIVFSGTKDRPIFR